MTHCRTCKSDRLHLFLELGTHPLANGFLTEEMLAEPEPTFPLDVYACLNCGLIQIADNIPPGFFRHYVYVPSASDVMRDHFEGLAELVASKVVPDDAGLTIDIGCNDGLFLHALQKRGRRTLGIDPATNLVEVAREQGLEIVNEYFDPETALDVRRDHGPAALIVTTNTFHHIGDLDTFTDGVRLLLDDDGVFIVEVPHALELVELNQFDGIYHEHVSQMTVTSLAKLFERFDLEVFDVEGIGVHGGSMRVFARRASGREIPSHVQSWLDRESEHRLFDADTYTAFAERVEHNRTVLMSLLDQLKRDGRRIAGYGASARGNTLLNFFKIGVETLDFIVDRNRLKHGLYTPGMHIPVVAPEAILQEQPDYLLIIAWNFADEIMDQQTAYRDRGGSFILPIPEPRVVGTEPVLN